MSAALTVPVGEVADINPTFKSITISLNELVDFLPMAAVEERSSVATATEHRFLSDVLKGYTSFNDGDVLLAKITPCFENGKIAQVRLKHRYGFGSTEFHVLRPHAEKLDARYLVHFLRRDEIRRDGARKMTGSAGQRRVPKHFLESLPIYLPAISEQRRIAAILDQADMLRAKRREALAQLDELQDAIFIEMFGDPKKNPKSLRKVSLHSLLKLKSGEFLPSTEMVNTGPYPVFGGNGINGTHDKFLFEARKIVIGRVGVYCGCVHVSPARSWITDNALYVSEHDASVKFDFLSFSLKLAKLNQYASQSAQPLISGSRIYPVEILVPPIASQLEFIERAEKSRNLANANMESSKALDDLFSSLQHRAFRGEL